MSYLFNFEKLDVWQKSRLFAKEIYSLTTNEQFGLTSQLRRASVSIAPNLAEGSSRNTGKEQAQFTQISYGSLMEVMSYLFENYGKVLNLY